MGGRTIGFLGGALFTSALVYYTGEYIKKDQRFVSRQLRISDTIIKEGIIGGKDMDPVKAAAFRGSVTKHAGVMETSKDIWNEEIIKMVNWLYSINWYDLGVKTDSTIADLTTKVAHSAVEKK